MSLRQPDAASEPAEARRDALRVAYALEFPTVLGGERSLLCLLGAWRAGVRAAGRAVVPVVVAPALGPMSRALAAGGHAHVPLALAGRSHEARAAALAEALAAYAPALIHGNSLMLGDVVAGAAERLGCPAVTHARDIMRLSAARIQRLGRLAGILAVSSAARNALIAQGIDPARVTVVHNGIAGDRWDRRGLAPGRLRALLGAGEHDIVLLLVGQIATRKDPLAFLEGAAGLAALCRATGVGRLERGAPIHAVIVGARASDRPESVALDRALEARARELPQAGVRVTRLGQRDDVAALLRDASVLVSTSRQEPWGRTILEALALEVPIVATDVGGTRELTGDGAYALLVPPGDPQALARALAALLSDPQAARQRAAAGRAHVVNCLTPGSMAKGTAAVYERILGAPARRGKA